MSKRAKSPHKLDMVRLADLDGRRIYRANGRAVEAIEALERSHVEAHERLRAFIREQKAKSAITRGCGVIGLMFDRAPDTTVWRSGKGCWVPNGRTAAGKEMRRRLARMGLPAMTDLGKPLGVSMHLVPVRGGMVLCGVVFVRVGGVPYVLIPNQEKKHPIDCEQIPVERFVAMLAAHGQLKTGG